MFIGLGGRATEARTASQHSHHLHFKSPLWTVFRMSSGASLSAPIQRHLGLKQELAR